MLVLLIGDFYIPERAIDIPAKFKKLLVPGKISTVLATGSLSPLTKSYLETICRTVISCSPNSKSSFISKRGAAKVVEYDGWRIGLIDHSSALLDKKDVLEKEAIARHLNVDVLISNGTHIFNAYDRNDRFYVDPGSATGAFTFDADEDEIYPSFVLMDLNPKALTFYIYKLIQGQVKVEKLDFAKP
jgi:vacuolar protein sorting-associated protein 29